MGYTPLDLLKSLKPDGNGALLPEGALDTLKMGHTPLDLLKSLKPDGNGTLLPESALDTLKLGYTPLDLLKSLKPTRNNALLTEFALDACEPIEGFGMFDEFCEDSLLWIIRHWLFPPKAVFALYHPANIVPRRARALAILYRHATPQPVSELRPAGACVPVQARAASASNAQALASWSDSASSSPGATRRL
jgi:hypothetical protein